MKRCRGFTLLEVLVAIAFLAVAFSAVSRIYGDNINTVVHLKQKTLAHWVAQNIIQETSLKLSLPAAASRSGVVHMANADWYWQLQVTPIGDAGVRQLQVDVSSRKGAPPIARLQTFTGIPHEQAR